jgi:hypothetical protein
MTNLDAYDDMMGLEFGDMELGEGLLDPEYIREALMSSTAGGGAMLLTSWGVKTLSENVELINGIQNPLLKAATVSTIAFLGGVMGSSALFEYNRPAAVGVMGGVGGMAVAHLLDAMIAQFTGSAKMGIGLGEGDDYSYDEGMAALAALETTGVTSAPGAFHGLADPTVTPEALMGLDGTTVQQETLGELSAYQGYLS